MSPSPDFAAMLTVITARAGLAAAKQATTRVAVATCAGSMHSAAVSHVAAGPAGTGISIAGAVTDGYIGMAERQLVRGDIEGAAAWSRIAAEHD